MGTRSLSNELDDLAHTELADLAPEDRLHLILKATAANDAEARDRLVDTIPTYNYEAGDLEYRQLATNMMLISVQAERDLLSSYLEFQWIDTELTKGIVMDMLGGIFEDGELAIDDPAALREQPTSEEVTEEFERVEDHLVDTAADLYIDYHTYQAFAHEHLGVSLETLIGHRSQTTYVVEFVEDLLDRCEEEGLLARANEWCADIAADVKAEAEADPEFAELVEDLGISFPPTLDDLAESRYNSLATEWNESR